MSIHYVTVQLRPSTSQQAALDQLLEDQQNPASAHFRKWVTPEQYADQFGVSQGDIAKITEWLRARGLSIDQTARGRNWIAFSGTAGGIGTAFGTEIHRYRVDGEVHFSNATDPSIPEAFKDVVAEIRGLDDFVPKARPLVRHPIPQGAQPDFNGSQGFHFLAPGDLATIYDIAPLHAAGYSGQGQKIVVVGQSDFALSDLQTFQKQFQLSANNPQQVLVGPDPGKTGAEAEADLDLQWVSAVAPNAAITYVLSVSAFVAAQYAVDQNLAPVITMSYGECEQVFGSAFRVVAQQANAQGITWLASSGDSGAAGCEISSNAVQAKRGMAVNFPASIPEITAVGGTEFNEGNANYWGNSGSNGGTALSYIPEIAWNDTAVLNELWATGGGASIFFSKPAWQTGPGVPNDGARDVPDLSLAASFYHDGFLVYSEGAEGAYGGTSAATPSFAGIVVLLNQYLLANGTLPQAGLGNINPTLYRLAQIAPNSFHDITSGDNIVPCVQSSPNCSTGSFGFPAGPGFDQATGLGSVDANLLVTQWAQFSNSTTTTLLANPSTAAPNSNIQLTATVKAFNGVIPTGTVTFSSGGATLGSIAIAGSGGTASLSVTAGQLGAGSQVVSALYSGDGNSVGSVGSTTVTVAVPSGSSDVIASITNPVFEGPQTASGFNWVYTVTLTETAGAGTTLTDFTLSGTSYASQIVNFFGSATLRPLGKLSAPLSAKITTVPSTLVFGFTGIDANGQTWSRQVPVQFNGPLLEPSIALVSVPSAMYQNTAAAANCQWSQLLNVQEQSGFGVVLTRMVIGGVDRTSLIPSYFGTTRLAPYGSLQAPVCWANVTAGQSESYEIDGTTDMGSSVAAALAVSFAGPSPSPSVLSVSPGAIAQNVAGAPQTAVSVIGINVTGPGAQWAISVSPSNRSTSWLSVSALSGTGPANVNLQMSAVGLANGVYTATLTVQSVTSIPQYIQIPVTFVVGPSNSTAIGGMSNAASSQVVFAPGMLASVYGSQLAPSGFQGFATFSQQGALPLTLGGVSATVNGVSAPLYFVSGSQINLQIPYETGSGLAVLGVNNNGQVAIFPFQAAASGPGIFTDSNGNTVPYASGSRGDTLVLFITGEGDVAPVLPTGFTPSPVTPIAQLPQPRLPVSMTIGGVPATIEFVGIPPGLAGVTQINFQVPSTAPHGVQQLIVTVGGVASAPANFTVN